jgi:MFS family permease
VNLWFFRQRGLALGVTLIGTSLTGMAVPKIAAFGIEHYGWRATFPILAALPLLLALPFAIAWFREPRVEQRPLEVGSHGALTGMTTAQAFRNRRFWLIFASIVLIAMAYGGVYVHLMQMLLLKGFEKHLATNVVVTLSASILLGRVGTGFLLDKFWAPLITLPLLSAPAIACLLLAADSLSLQGALGCALLVGLAAGAETDLIAYLAGRYFGMREYGRIYGFLYMPFGAASAISPAVYGWVRDTTGNYNLALHWATGMFVAGAILLLLLGRYPDFSTDTGSPQRD